MIFLLSLYYTLVSKLHSMNHIYFLSRFIRDKNEYFFLSSYYDDDT